MKKKRHFSGEDRVLRFAVMMMLALLITGAAVLGLRMRNLRVDSSAGEKKLKELAGKDVQEIDARIRELEEEEERVLEERKNRTIEEKIADCVILGDSICQGLYEYGYTDSSVVSCASGLNVASPDETGLTDMLLQAVSDDPQKIFLVFGRGDIETEGEEAEVFARAYDEMLGQLMQALPDSEIYVNSILPAGQADTLTTEYNKKLAELCESIHVTFIDNTKFIKDEYYEEDGIHMTASFYSEWLSYMVEQAGL